MPRDRFLQIYWNLHLCDPVPTPSSPRCAKVQPLLDLLCPQFESAFKLGRYIAVDEAFVLADSATGYVQRLRLYFGAETDLLSDSSLLHTTRVVLTLTQPLEGLGYHVITDRFYTSPELAMELDRRGLAFTGTAQVNRRGMPLAIKSGGRNRMERGSVRAY